MIHVFKVPSFYRMWDLPTFIMEPIPEKLKRQELYCLTILVKAPSVAHTPYKTQTSEWNGN